MAIYYRSFFWRFWGWVDLPLLSDRTKHDLTGLCSLVWTLQEAAWRQRLRSCILISQPTPVAIGFAVFHSQILKSEFHNYIIYVHVITHTIAQSHYTL